MSQIAATVANPAPPDNDPWADLMPPPQTLPTELVDEGRAIPIARVRAMHEGKRRARAARTKEN